MPVITVKLIEGELNWGETAEMIENITQAVTPFVGEEVRSNVWVLVEQVKSGPWNTGGRAFGHAGARLTQQSVSEDRKCFFRGQRPQTTNAMAPDEGETVGELFHRAEPNPNTRPQLDPDEDGFLWLPAGGFFDAVAPDASKEETALMQINQHPIALKCLGEPMTAPAWKQRPSWFLIAEKDRMISAAMQHFMADRIKARVHSRNTDHTPLASDPESVVRVITEAADAVI
jgi:phenylpyruvate tautomerase PptA (4-oxalocrotonate tautomerase family)